LEFAVGMPAVLTARSDSRMLAAAGVTGMRPWMDPAPRKSACVARTKLLLFTAPRPN